MPSTATIRFTLLIVLVVVTSAAIGAYVSMLNSSGQRAVKAALPCLARAGMVLNGTDVTGAATGSVPMLRCGAAMIVIGLAGMGVVAAAVAIATYLLYLVLPSWRIRRHHLVRLPADAEALHAFLASLVHELRLPRPPDFLIAPYNRIPAGLAFGRRGRPMVQINAGLVPLYLTDRDTLRAVVLHELAHVRNGDIGKTYVTVAVWRAFLLLAFAPFVVLSIFPDLIIGPDHFAFTDVSNGLIRSTKIQSVVAVAALTALIYLTRAAVLRSRENLADATAVDYGGHALVPVLANAHRHPPLGRLAALLRSHPAPTQRLHYLNEPGERYRFSLGEVFAAGVAISVICTSVLFVLEFAAKTRALLPYLATVALLVTLVIAVLYCALIALYFGVVYWRVATGAAAGAGGRPTAVAAAAAMTAGILIGEPLSVAGALGGLRLGVFGSVTTGVNVFSGTVSALLLFGGVLMLARWTRDSAVLRVARSPHLNPRTGYLQTAAVGALAFLCGFWIWYIFRGSTEGSHVYVYTEQLARSRGQPYGPLPGFGWLNAQYDPLEYLGFVPFVTALLALPWVSIAITVIRRAPKATADELDAAHGANDATMPRVPIGRALLTGCGGGATCVLLTAVLLWLAAPWIAETRARYGLAVNRYVLVSYIDAAAAIGALLAILLVATTPRLGITLGLAASFVSGTLATAAMPFTYALARCPRPLTAGRVGACLAEAPVRIYPYLYNQIIVRGALAAMVAGLLCAAAATVARTAPSATSHGKRRASLPVRRTQVAVALSTATLSAIALAATVVNTAELVGGW